MSGCAATAGERDVSGSAFAPRIQRRSTGCDCRNRDCPPKYCLCGSSLRTSDTGSPNIYYLWLPRSRRTMGPRKSELAVNQQSRQQEQRWQLEGESSSVSIDAIQHRAACQYSLPTSLAVGVMSALPPQADIERGEWGRKRKNGMSDRCLLYP
jgi:hypothetical protein